MPRRAVTEKASGRNGIAEAVDPRQLELSIDGRAARANGAARAHGDEAERAQSIVSSLDHLSSEEVFAAFAELDALPPDVVRAALAAATGPAPDPERLDDATRRAHGFPPRSLELSTLSIVRDADLFDVGEVAEQQVRIAGIAWDGRDLDAFERLDEEVEGSFAGTLERRVLGDVAGRPLYDVLRYAGEGGTIFRAGTTELVGSISGPIVEMSDRRARAAIQSALGEPADLPPPTEPEPPTEPAPISVAPRTEDEGTPPPVKPKKRAAAKRPAAEAKTVKAPKKTAAAKAPAKKTTAKKATAKKATAKKASR